MTHQLIRSETKHTFVVDTGTLLPVAWNSESGFFRPERVIIESVQSSGGERHVEVWVTGPIIRNGKPLKTKGGFLRWSPDMFEVDWDGPDDQRPPQWLRALVEEFGFLQRAEAQ